MRIGGAKHGTVRSLIRYNWSGLKQTKRHFVRFFCSPVLSYFRNSAIRGHAQFPHILHRLIWSWGFCSVLGKSQILFFQSVFVFARIKWECQYSVHKSDWFLSYSCLFSQFRQFRCWAKIYQGVHLENKHFMPNTEYFIGQHNSHFSHYFCYIQLFLLLFAFYYYFLQRHWKCMAKIVGLIATVGKCGGLWCLWHFTCNCVSSRAWYDHINQSLEWSHNMNGLFH